MKCLEDYFEKMGVSKFPPCGRFHLAGFNFDNMNAYAILHYTPLERRSDEVAYLKTVEGCREPYNVEHLSVLHDTLPDGDERDYIAAIHDAIEGLNGFNMNIRQVYDFAHDPSRADRIPEVCSEGVENFAAATKEALQKLSSFGDKKEYALNRGDDVDEILAENDMRLNRDRRSLRNTFDM